MPIAAILPFFSTFVGGFAALRLRHRLHPFMAFASGVLEATAIADLLPEAHALVGPGGVVEVGVAAMAGYLLFTLIESFIHQTSFEHQKPAHGQEPAESATAQPPRTKLAILPPISLILHSTLDGLAIGLGFQAGADIGVIVLVAVLAHDFADGMNVVALALDAAGGAKLAISLLLLDALAPLLGVGLSTVLSVSPQVLGLLLAWFAGVFIAIGATHLLPESQHHRPADGPLLVGLSALGAAVVIVVRLLAGP